jgi:SMC interacting uncharacterized protein involved in chromosome segregation
MGDEKIPERVAVLENCYQNLKEDLFGGEGKDGAFPALNKKVEDVKSLFTNHLEHLKKEQEKKEEEYQKNQKQFSRRRFDVLLAIINAILALGVAVLIPIGIIIVSKLTHLNLMK